MYGDFLFHLELANLMIAERHRWADRERLARLARTARERSNTVAAIATRSPRTTVPAAGA